MLRSLFVFTGNGKTKQSSSRCAVEISEIVNRIAPQVINCNFLKQCPACAVIRENCASAFALVLVTVVSWSELDMEFLGLNSSSEHSIDWLLCESQMLSKRTQEETCSSSILEKLTFRVRVTALVLRDIVYLSLITHLLKGKRVSPHTGFMWQLFKYFEQSWLTADWEEQDPDERYSAIIVTLLQYSK